MLEKTKMLLGVIILLLNQQLKAQFEPDTSINGKIFLLNSKSIKKEVGDIMPKLNTKESFSNVYILNKSGNQYLKLIFHPGDFKNSFAMFEVGYPSSQMKIKNRLKYAEFYTERGIKLGITKPKFLSIIGSHIKKVKGKDEYLLKISTPKDPFLEMYGLPAYEAKYIFKNNILIKFYFGFEYP
jgi:hypothetical protein